MILQLSGLGTQVKTFRSMKLLISSFIASYQESLSEEFIAILYVGELTVEAE